MISLDEAAGALGLAPEAYREKARAGEALLLCVEGVDVVPAWSVKNGRIDDLVVDAAREIDRKAIGEYRELRFMAFLRFMTEEKAEIAQAVAPEKLRDAFQKAGVSDYECHLSVKASMVQLLARRDANPLFFRFFVNHLHSAFSGGWDNTEPGLSAAFVDKYQLPKTTLAFDA